MTFTKSLPEPEVTPPNKKDNGSGQRSEKMANESFEAMAENLKVKSKSPMTTSRATYVLYALAVVTGAPMLIGLIVAYVVRNDAPAWLQTHYNFLIRTFWYGLMLVGVGILTFIIGIGMFLLWLMPIWYVVRIVRGWMLLENQKPIPNPESWLFS